MGEVGRLAEHCCCILGSAAAGLLITFSVALVCIGHHCKLGYLQLLLPTSSLIRNGVGGKDGEKQDTAGWLVQLVAGQDLIRR